MEFTAVCKTDCILLSLNDDVFEIIHRKNVYKYREDIAQYLIKIMPNVENYYPDAIISDTAYQMMIE
jgi:hypothetical protein